MPTTPRSNPSPFSANRAPFGRITIKVDDRIGRISRETSVIRARRLANEILAHCDETESAAPVEHPLADQSRVTVRGLPEYPTYIWFGTVLGYDESTRTYKVGYRINNTIETVSADNVEPRQ
jgi:hypothetical protein